jgi:predicted nucleic acid-binding protein
MSAFLDSSVLVAALAPDELKHADCLALLLKGGNCIYSHALLETFSTLTGGKLGVRVTPDLAAQMLSETILPRVTVVELSTAEIMTALGIAQSQGVRGGCVYDYMHLLAAKKATHP